ncbi:precorrin-2 dehydrogenase/sirohydrochlorin ferrochelatase family protein [Paenibacillus swuensis]
MKGRLCTVVGGGSVAERKIRSLMDTDARIKVIAPRWTPAITKWIDEGLVLGESRVYRDGDLKGSFIVYASTDVPSVNEQVCLEAEQEGMMFNRSDQADTGDWVDPAVVRRGQLAITVSTGGASPGMAKAIQCELQQEYGPEFEEALDWLAGLRVTLKETLADPRDRQRILKELWTEDTIDQIRNGELHKLKQKIAVALEPGGK